MVKINPHFLIIGGGVLQAPLVEEIQKTPYKSIVVDQDENCIAKEYADYFLKVSTKDSEKIYKMIIDLNIQVDYCLTLGTDMSYTVASLNEKLKLKGLTCKQAQVTIHKGDMRDFLQNKALLPQPVYYVSQNKENVYKWMKEHRCTDGYVIKPVDNMGSRGVLYLKEPLDLSYAFEYALQNSHCKEIIVEEYIKGLEISVDAMCISGKCYLVGVADRNIHIHEEMYFIETGHNMPAQIQQHLIVDIQEQLQTVCNALSHLEDTPYKGFLKADVKIDTHNKVIIQEVASRLSGGYMSTYTYPLASGNNLMQAIISLYNNTEILFIKQKQHDSYNKVCIERNLLAEVGELYSINIEDIQELTYQTAFVEKVFAPYKIGDYIYTLTSNVGKLMHVIIVANTLEDAEALWKICQQKLEVEIHIPSLTYENIRRQAKKKFNAKYCWVCRECDGYNCASSVPGMGALDKMLTFQKNISSLKDISLKIHYIDKTQKSLQDIDLSTNILGVNVDAPLLTAPITGSITNMGSSITEWDYAYESGMAATKLNLIPTFGDGATEDKYYIGLKAIEKLKRGFPVFKPRRDLELIKNRILLAEKMRAKAWGMDIDGIHFKTMKAKKQTTSRKTLEDLKYLKDVSRMPFFIKGVMSIEDAHLAALSGARAIIVSNHGGRTLDHLPATVEILPAIAKFIKDTYPSVQVFVDGGIRSGQDIFKMLALGADAVLVGRPVVIANVAYQQIGVYNLLNNYIQELRHTMTIFNINKLSEINPNMLLNI